MSFKSTIRLPKLTKIRSKLSFSNFQTIRNFPSIQPLGSSIDTCFIQRISVGSLPHITSNFYQVSAIWFFFDKIWTLAETCLWWCVRFIGLDIAINEYPTNGFAASRLIFKNNKKLDKPKLTSNGMWLIAIRLPVRIVAIIANVSHA